MDERTVKFSVFFISGSILAYEIIFTRIFAWAHWVNLSSLIITMALLGFGASGSIICIFQDRIKHHFHPVFFTCLVLFPIFLAFGSIISSSLEFNPYELGFSVKKICNMFFYFFIMGLSFFLGAFIICMGFLRSRISAMYFYNLSGSGVGVITVTGVSFYFHPVHIMMCIILMAAIPAIVAAAQIKNNHILVTGVFTMMILIPVYLMTACPDAKRVSPYKTISGALCLPKAKVIHEAYSPLAVVEVVEARGLRTTSGLSLVSPFQVPVQKGIFFNSGSMSPITPYDGNNDKIKYLEYLASYLPFHVKEKKDRNRVLIIGAGGGESILKSILSGFKQINALEVDSNVISMMTQKFGTFSGHIYNNENVIVLNQEARSYILQTQLKYDLIEISMIDAYNTAASGVYALNESYLYTIESIRDYLNRLKENGVLAISRWIVTPARDNLKIFNMVIQALHGMGIENAEKHLIAIRSLQTLTLLVSLSPIQDQTIEKTKFFSKKCLFDLVFYPGILEHETNRLIKLDTPVYYRGIKKLLSPHSKDFIKSYDFDIGAAKDNRPYFYNFFKPSMIKLIKTYGPSQIPVTEWGYLILVMVLLPVLIIAFGFIVFPVLLTRQKKMKMKKINLAYFSLIGLAYFFIEMPLIQKMGMFLGHPSYSISVIIAGLLIFSGIGSLLSEKIFPKEKRVLTACMLIVLITSFYLIFIDQILFYFITWHVGLKILLTLIILLPLGFFMGFPFPCALSFLNQKHGSLPWVWGVNGFSSVISILLAALLAMLFGFNFVLTAAILCYACAGVLWHYQAIKLQTNL